MSSVSGRRGVLEARCISGLGSSVKKSPGAIRVIMGRQIQKGSYSPWRNESSFNMRWRLRGRNGPNAQTRIIHRIGYKPAGSHYSVFVARSTTEQLSTILGAQGLASTQSLRVALIQLVEQAWMLLSDFHFDMSLADTPSDTVSWSPIFRSDPIVKQSLPVVHRPVLSPQGQPEKHQSRVMQR
jgi:hypothetical protein